MCILNGTKTVMTPQSRIEKILIAVINGEDLPTVFESEAEKAFVEAFKYPRDMHEQDNILYLKDIEVDKGNDTIYVDADAYPDGDVVYLKNVETDKSNDTVYIDADAYPDNNTLYLKDVESNEDDNVVYIGMHEFLDNDSVYLVNTPAVINKETVTLL